jgi:NADH-quinone oxidoreductase subunit J
MDLYLVIICILFIFIGLFVILTNNPVHSILALVLIFFLSSCLTLSLGVEFLAILILIVYVGAISVLFLFVVMLLNIRVLELNISLLKYWWLGVLYSLFFLFNLAYVIAAFSPSDGASLPYFTDFNSQSFEWSSISQFGELVFLYFPHFLICAGLILFIAIVSPVVLSFVSFSYSGPNSVAGKRTQDIFLQTLRLSVDKNF